MNKNQKILRFYLLATTLKNKIRQGSIYWNVQAPRRESVAEHIYDTCILAISINSELNLDIDIKKTLEMLIIHELEEIVIGDITPFDNVTEEEKLAIGKKAVLEILSGLTKENKYIALTNEFNKRKSREAKFAYLCDKLDFDLQMKLYIDKGQIVLDKDFNSPVFKTPKVQEMIKDGCTDPADIFYEYDYKKFEDCPEILDLLNYSYSTDLSKLLDKYLNELK